MFNITVKVGAKKKRVKLNIQTAMYKSNGSKEFIFSTLLAGGFVLNLLFNSMHTEA